MYGRLGKKTTKKMAGMKKRLGKGGTPKAKSAMMKMKADKKAKKSKSMYARRAGRNKANRLKGKNGMDVHHKDGNPLNNSRKNLAVTSKKANRSFARNKKAGKK